MRNTPVYSHIQLPLTNLHYITIGKGEPLIIVPATISRIENWLDLIEFMAQKFKVHFFELPGHGQSTSFTKPYTSSQVAQTIEHFMDALGYKKSNIMGFSFGGILTLTTVSQIPDRIIRVILIAPCLSYRTIRFSLPRLLAVKLLVDVLKRKKAQHYALQIMHNRVLTPAFVHVIGLVGKIETTITKSLDKKLVTMPPSTLNVLVSQIFEITHTDFNFPAGIFNHPCFFLMSRLDPLLDYQKTKKTLIKWFPDLRSKTLNVPFHQLPEIYSFNKLNESYGYIFDEMGV